MAQEPAVFIARELLALAGREDVKINDQPLRRGPELVEVDGIEFVELYVGDQADPEAFTRYLLRADARIAGDPDDWQGWRQPAVEG